MRAPMIPRPLLLAALAAALLAGCLDNVAAPEDGATPPTNTTDDGAGGNSTMAPMDVTVTVGESVGSVPPSPMLYTLSPAKLELHVGMPVNLTLKNDGQGPHDLVIEGIEGAKVESVDGGASKSVLFTPTEAGTFQMYCTLGAEPLDHQSNGMAGEVEVK